MRSHILVTTALFSLPPLAKSIYLLTSPTTESIELEAPDATWTNEDFLARGYTIPLTCVTAPTLERIPTISSKKAETILHERDSLLQRLSRGDSSSLSSVHGIGEKGARYLERYISYEITTPFLLIDCER